MIWSLLATGVLIVHAAFVAFVVFGALLVVKWKWIGWVHPFALAWGAFTEFAGIICPLTPLEVHLRQLGGEAGYSGGFIEHYLIATLYPAGLTRTLQVWLGFGAILPNILIYGWLMARRKARSRSA